VIGNVVVMNLIPTILLIVLNMLIYRAVSRHNSTHNQIAASHRRDSTMAALLFCIVAVFFLCHSTKIITNVYEAVQMVQYGTMNEWSAWANVMSRWNHMMLAVNSSINIIIYVAKDLKFRRALAALLCITNDASEIGVNTVRTSIKRTSIKYEQDIEMMSFRNIENNGRSREDQHIRG